MLNFATLVFALLALFIRADNVVASDLSESEASKAYIRAPADSAINNSSWVAYYQDENHNFIDDEKESTISDMKEKPEVKKSIYLYASGTTLYDLYSSSTPKDLARGIRLRGLSKHCLYTTTGVNYPLMDGMDKLIISDPKRIESAHLNESILGFSPIYADSDTYCEEFKAALEVEKARHWPGIYEMPTMLFEVNNEG